MLRRLYRYLFPRLRDSLLDAPIATARDDPRFESRYLALVDRHDPFLAARYFEGTRWRQVLKLLGVSQPVRILDLGAGDGAIELAFAAAGHYVVSVDRGWNDNARQLGVHRVIADSAALPFRENVFDAMLCLETVEHLSQVRQTALDVARVLRTNGLILLTTPPRWRFVWQPDPHFGIRFLLLFPPAVQRALAARRGFDQPHHYVDRIYSSTGQLAHALRPLRLERVLSRSRAPSRWFWDAVVLRKSSS